MTRNIKKKLYREKICLVQILRDLKKIKNRKKIYNKKMKNVIGVDIKVPQIVGQFNLKNNHLPFWYSFDSAQGGGVRVLEVALTYDIAKELIPEKKE